MPPKVVASIENSLDFLDAHVDAALAALPADRHISFLEVTLFCLVTHLPFRAVMSVDGLPQLARFATSFGARASALATPYVFDAAGLRRAVERLRACS